MNREVELKLKLADPQHLRALLTRLNAPPAGPAFERNRIFDSPDRRLLRAGCGLRLRETRSPDAPRRVPPAARPPVQPQCVPTLTFKGPREPGVVKSRGEWETTVVDAAALAEILSRIGFAEVIAYEKRRETCRVHDCEICIDELPRLGWFVEIEGPTAAAVRAVQSLLKLPDAAIVPESYVELAARHGDATPDGRHTLAFPP